MTRWLSGERSFFFFFLSIFFIFYFYNHCHYFFIYFFLFISRGVGKRNEQATTTGSELFFYCESTRFGLHDLLQDFVFIVFIIIFFLYILIYFLLFHYFFSKQNIHNVVKEL